MKTLFHHTFSPCLLIAGFLFLCSCGTTGKITAYEYRVSKDTLAAAIQHFFAANPAYRFPAQDSSWRSYKHDSTLDFSLEDGHLRYRTIDKTPTQEFIYFENGPEELYYLKYYMNEKYWATHPGYSRIALVAVAKKGKKWRYSDPVLNKYFWGRARIEKRLETEMLNKLPYRPRKLLE